MRRITDPKLVDEIVGLLWSAQAKMDMLRVEPMSAVERQQGTLRNHPEQTLEEAKRYCKLSRMFMREMI